MSLDNWNKGCSIRREIDKPNPEKGLLCQRAGSPTSGKFEEQAGCRDGGPGPHRRVRACAGPREQMQRRLERVKTGTQAESSRTAELGGLRQGKMSARETEDNQGHEDAPGEDCTESGGWDLSSRVSAKRNGLVQRVLQLYLES